MRLVQLREAFVNDVSVNKMNNGYLPLLTSLLSVRGHGLVGVVAGAVGCGCCGCRRRGGGWGVVVERKMDLAKKKNPVRDLPQRGVKRILS